MLDVVIHLHGDTTPFGMSQGSFKTFGQTLADISPYLDAVDHDIDGVFGVLAELRQGVDVVDLAIHAQAHKALRLEFGE